MSRLADPASQTAPTNHNSSHPQEGMAERTSKQWINRRGILAVLGLAVSSTSVAATQTPSPSKRQRRQHRDDAVATALAKQEIAELRCQYARATDLIGTTQPDAVAEGRRIYHRIFKPDAVIGATGRDNVTGPDAWVEVVLDALKVYENTQHLIGTQLVEIESLPRRGANIGRANMSSYLQAWHAKADGELWLFIGSYADEVEHSPEHGWQISHMMLEQVSGETRQLNQ